jgi:hypothetical protein
MRHVLPMSMPGVLPMSMPATHPNPLPEERVSAGTALEDSNVVVAVAASLFFVSEAHINQARSFIRRLVARVLPESTGKMTNQAIGQT